MFLQNTKLILHRSLPVQQWLSEWWGHAEQIWNWWWRWRWWYVKTTRLTLNSLLSWGTYWILIDTNLQDHSCLITCKTFTKTENFSQISFWLNLAYLFWYYWIHWPWKWWFSCQNQISRLCRRWDIDQKPFSRQPFCKIQDGGQIGLGANGNIVFLIAYTIRFPKMYSFDTLQKIPAKLHSEPDYIRAS